MLIDTSAWVEFLLGSRKGNRVRERINSEACYSSIVTIAELSNWAQRENQATERIIDAVKELSAVIGLDEDIAVLAGKLNFNRKKENRKWGIMDSMILATAEMYDMEILTCDNDFSDVSKVTVLR
ncbi:MAG: PIN domain-containing protein [Thermoplasmatales archaeon]|jgi:predicted nucleic acid-binding protein|nr:PIN domain-containing protein [Candidatus Thermoplasmatota archaeon]MDA8054958.1 PIN domain-containing protein [Thermoplasmatales archaeon]